jgi:hypothetical protein
MPGQGDVEAVEQPIPRHDRLTEDDLLSRATVEHDGALLPLRPQRLRQGDGRSDGPDPEQVVAAAVPRRARLHRLLRPLAGRLGETRQGVVLGQKGDHGLSMAGGRHERGRHPCHAALHLETAPVQIVGQQGRGARLAQCDLRESPDLLA